MTIWRGKHPLILASQSRARQTLLANAAIPFDAMPADIDERAVQRKSGLSAPGEIAGLLAREKALLRFFAPPEARAMLAGLGLGVVAWPEPMLQQLADYYVQRASEQGVFERYEDLRSYGIPLPHLQDLVRDADGSPTKLLADLRAALIKAAGAQAAP